MKRMLAAAVAALLMVAIGYVATNANATGAGATAQRGGGLAEGYYSGHDAHHRHIRFNYAHANVTGFRVDHDRGRDIHVGHDSWEQGCVRLPSHVSLLTSSGRWTTSHKVEGTWRLNCGTTHHFEAHWVSEHPQ